jgi:hypothetical protein
MNFPGSQSHLVTFMIKARGFTPCSFTRTENHQAA